MAIRPLYALTLLVLLFASCAGEDLDAEMDAVSAVPSTATTATAGTTSPAADPTTASAQSAEPVTTISASIEEDPAPTSVTTTATTSAASETTTPFQISDDVPDLEMFDVATGARVSLRSVVKGEKPLMFWFWSPF